MKYQNKGEMLYDLMLQVFELNDQINQVARNFERCGDKKATAFLDACLAPVEALERHLDLQAETQAKLNELANPYHHDGTAYLDE